jgi:hypothetical protein
MQAMVLAGSEWAETNWVEGGWWHSDHGRFDSCAHFQYIGKLCCIIQVLGM